MRRRGASLVWCPTSNLAMLGRTVSRAVLRSGIPIALATDSALSAPVDLLDELAVARQVLAAGAALRDGHQRAGADSAASAAVASEIGSPSARRPEHPVEALFEGTVALVVVAGRIRLISPDLARQLPAAARRALPTVAGGRTARRCWWTPTSAQLRRAAAKHLGTGTAPCGQTDSGMKAHAGASADSGAGAAQSLQLPLRDVRHLEAHRGAGDQRRRAGTAPRRISNASASNGWCSRAASP